ncbi:MAG: transglycosylase domain-containing protein [bacterium]
MKSTPPRKRKPVKGGSPLQLRQVPDRPLPKSGSSLRKSSKPTSGWRRYNPLRKFRFTWKRFFIGLAIFVGVFVLGIAGVFAYYVRDLPNPKKIETRSVSQSTQILDRNGTLLNNIHGDENRTIVTNDQISTYLKNASVAVEDQSFYTNHGFDLRGIARAVGVRLHLVHGELAGGGSTITQQYIKVALVGDDHSLSRKIKELILAIEVDQTYSKSDILTGYLNQINYGGTIYGIQTASQTYFGVNAKDLTLSQSATLAAIPNEPTYYSPYGNHTDDLIIRKNYILDRMVTEKMITQSQADAAKKEAPTTDNLGFKKPTDLVAPQFVFYIKEQMAKMLDPDPQIAQKMLNEGGYTVTTSLDLPTQKMAEGIVSSMGPDVVKKYHATNACLTSVDPKTGQVLAMVGSISYTDSISGNTNFCTAQLQPGSSFKPFVYATAWSQPNTYSPSSITYDLKTDLGGGYSPNDYDGKNRGPITNRLALAGSLNIPAVKNLALVGVTNALTTASNLGITTLTQPASDYGLSLVLGSGSVKAVQMAGAYATFANNGNNMPLMPILQIKQGGKVIKDYTTINKPKQVLAPEVAYEISSVLSDASAKQPVFGALTKNLTLPDRPVAAKTGTTENWRDGWTIGYTPSIVTAVWVGNNNPNQTMTKGADGSIVAAPIWNKFMSEYLKGKPVEQFNRPDTVKDLTVDKLSGKLPTDQTPPDDLIKDIFAPWQMPKDKDDVHVKVTIAKGSGLLATALTPDDQKQDVTYITIHSEMPKNPAWEGPVQAWAKGTFGALLGSPPTQSDTLYTDANRPTISFTSPTDGTSVSGTVTLSASPGGSQPISQVEYFVNNVSVGKVTSAPWSLSYDTSGLPAGSQVIQAVATNSLGLTQTTQVSVTTNTDTSPPGNVIGTSASLGTHSVTPIHLTWINPSDSDLTSVAIYQSTDLTQLGTKVATVSATPNSSSSYDLTPPVGTYYYTLHPIDATGNENQSTVRVQGKMK